MPRFAALFVRGRAGIRSGNLRGQDRIAEHPAFLARQFAAATRVMGGPFTDGSGGM